MTSFDSFGSSAAARSRATFSRAGCAWARALASASRYAAHALAIRPTCS